MISKNTRRWILLFLIAFGLILVPYILFGEQIDAWFENFIHTASDRPRLTALVLIGMLAIDILAPIPSSIVSTSAGFFLGFLWGTLSSLAGMTISNIIGYLLAARFGQPLADRLVGSEEMKRLETMRGRIGDWIIVTTRPVPVLAETSVLFAGVSRLPFSRFMLLSTLSNLAISLIYAAVGAFSYSVNSFLLAFAGSVLLPGLAMYLTRRKSDLEELSQEK